MRNLLHVELTLIISKVFIILCLFCQCRNREYRGNFKKKTVICKQLFFQMSAQVKLEGRPFWSGQEAKIYSTNYLLSTYGGNVNYSKSVHHPILTLPLGTGSTMSIFKINQLTLLSIEFPDIFSSWPNWNGKERPFLEGCKKRDHIAILSLGWYK